MKRVVAVLSLGFLLLITGCAGLPPTGGPLTAIACQLRPGLDDAVVQNKRTLTDPAWAPFGRAEAGWSVYAVRAAHDIKTACAPKTPGFAARLARWQARHEMAPTGKMDPATFQTFKTMWQQARPFVTLRAGGACPDPPRDSQLAQLPAGETLDGKPVRLRADALRAYEAMYAQARRDLGQDALAPDRLTVFSGFRSPDYDAARCGREQNCDGVGRAACSAHRTGLAVDLTLGAAPGFTIDSSQDANRLWQTRTKVYQWLIQRAGLYGFVNYAFEPWHWEWRDPAA